MKPKNSGSGRRIVCLVLVAVMLLGLISSALIIMVNAASSSEIKKELNGLRSQQAELKKEREALQVKSTPSAVEQMFDKIKAGEVQELPVVVKADVQRSVGHYTI